MKTLTKSQPIVFPNRHLSADFIEDYREDIEEDIIYPESDGQPMADNTKQFRVITTIQGNLDSLYKDDPLVLVVGDLFWYPVKGNNEIKCAPDVMVVFGVPKGERRSYLQWRENNIAPQVAFEIRSPSNTNAEMNTKRIFYETHGVLEYYMYDPDRGKLEGWQRWGARFRQIEPMKGWVSPQLNIRFDLVELELRLYDADDKPFLNFVELNEQRQLAEQQVQAETSARIEAELQAVQADQRAEAEAQARALAEENLQAEAQARALAEENLQAEAQARTNAEARLREAENKLRELGLL